MGIALVSMYAGANFFRIAIGGDLRKIRAENESASEAIDRALEKRWEKLFALAYEAMRVSMGMSRGYISLAPIIAVILLRTVDVLQVESSK